ncbi:response regulator [Pseudotabrizicola alkalilacus]|nr:response regulator [Pseudotabrizicola alkalilacus]
MQSLTGRNVMIVEDDFLIAADLADHFRAARAHVLGPFSTVAAALDHTAKAEMAVLDLNLRGHKVYPLADELMDAAVPFVFYSAQDLAAIPRRFAHIARLPKPLVAQEAATQLSRKLHEASIIALLPRLRLSARLILKDSLAADRLVEATLTLALVENRALGETPQLAEWLHVLMDKALKTRGRELMN